MNSKSTAIETRHPVFRHFQLLLVPSSSHPRALSWCTWLVGLAEQREYNLLNRGTFKGYQTSVQQSTLCVSEKPLHAIAGHVLTVTSIKSTASGPSRNR